MTRREKLYQLLSQITGKLKPWQLTVLLASVILLVSFGIYSDEIPADNLTQAEKVDNPSPEKVDNGSTTNKTVRDSNSSTGSNESTTTNSTG